MTQRAQTSIEGMVWQYFRSQLNIAREKDGWLVQLPFRDFAGDPMKLFVRLEQNQYVLEDAGSIAGAMFAMGQDSMDSPAIRLLKSLAKAYSAEVDFNTGTVRRVAQNGQMTEALHDMMKVIVTTMTVLPHMRVKPPRLGSLGPRLRVRFREVLKQWEVLHLVEPRQRVRGVAYDSWVVDYHYLTHTMPEPYEVYIATLDLDVTEPLPKVSEAISMAVDLKQVAAKQHLRMVCATGDGDPGREKAANFLRYHQETLGYGVFDLAKETERETLRRRVRQELISLG